MCHDDARVLRAWDQGFARSGSGEHPGAMTTAVVGSATLVANPEIGAVRLTSDLRDYGARANPWVLTWSNRGEPLWQNDLRPIRMTAIIRASGVMLPNCWRRVTGV